MAEHFQTTADSLLKGMENFITSKTVVGEAIHVGDTTILPLIEVSFGMAASARNEERKTNGGGGMGGKITPSAILVIQNGTCRLINIKSQDTVSKIVDMAPDLINRFMPGSRHTMDAETEEAVRHAAEQEETF